MSASRPWPPALAAHGPRADVGVFGGSGFYRFLDGAEAFEVETPYGPPSSPVVIGDVGGVRTAFIARHGAAHSVVAHAVNFRANLYAMAQLGVRHLVGPCAVGSLQRHLEPGHVVVTDQLVDRTWGRADTFFDGRDGVVNHVGFADPYDARLRSLVVAAAVDEGLIVHDGGTVVVINGPRFSTRAESRWFSEMGWSVVNMTQYPEAVLAAELAIPYVGISLVTDYDAGVDRSEAVTMEQVFAVLNTNIDKVRRVLFRMIPTAADVSG